MTLVHWQRCHADERALQAAWGALAATERRAAEQAFDPDTQQLRQAFADVAAMRAGHHAALAALYDTFIDAWTR